MFSFAQVQFQKTYGGTGDEYFYSTWITADGGYVCAGRTGSYGVGDYDCFLARLNANGDTLWTRTYGTGLYDEVQSVHQTADGGFIMAGHTAAFTDFNRDAYLLKTDANGILQWAKVYGLANFRDRGYSVRQTVDGGYIIAGETNGYGAGGLDMLLIKTDAAGTVTWSKTFGGANDETARSVRQLPDGGYILAGYTKTYGAGPGFNDVYVVRTSSTGNAIWRKTYGLSADDWGYTIERTTDGGYIIGATTDFNGTTFYDMALIKIDSGGTLTWAKRYGGSGTDFGTTAIQSADGGYLIGGMSNSFGAVGYDAYLVKTNATGVETWSKKYGGNGSFEQIWEIKQTTDLGYVLGGYTMSYGQGGRETWVMKATSAGVVGCNETTPTTVTTTWNVLTGTGGNTGSGPVMTNASAAVRRPNPIRNIQCFSGGPCPVNASFNASATTVCTGVAVTFTNTSTGATIYDWRQNNVNFASTTNTTRTFGSAGSYVISLIAGNGTCTDTATVTITVNAAPATPGTISGNATVCAGSANTYSVTAVPGATSYTWTLPGGWSGSSTTNSIATTAGTSGGTISVTASNTCGTSSPQTLSVTVESAPATPGTISGNATVCAGSANTYSVTAVPGATSYTWTLPGGWSGSSTTNSIATTAGTSGGTISVTASNTCGTSSPQSLTVTVESAPATPGTISGNATVCAGSANTYSVTAVPGATSYTWTLPGGWSGSSTTNSIATTAGTSGGTISVTASNTCGTSSPQSLQVTVESAPATPGNISGDATVCAGSANTYSVTAVPGATGYTWTLPGGWSGSSTTNSIATTAGTSGGTISVTASNSCGTSAAQTLQVTVDPSPIADFGSTTTGQTVTFSDLSTNSPTTWAWDFGDGATSTLQNPMHSYPSPGQYQVCLTVTNVCGTDSACHATDVLAGMSQVQTMRFTVYPNPNTGIFTVSAMLNGMDDIEFTLWDLNGNSVWKTSLTAQNGPLQSQIDVRPFATGLYFLEIKQGGSREFHKIVLEK